MYYIYRMAHFGYGKYLMFPFLGTSFDHTCTISARLYPAKIPATA